MTPAQKVSAVVRKNKNKINIQNKLQLIIIEEKTMENKIFF